MEITFLKVNCDHFYVVIGSNGLIGSSVVNSFKKRFEFNENNFFVKQNIIHKNLNLSILESLEIFDNAFPYKYSFIYCAGKGGFSLEHRLSIEQMEAFHYLIINLVRNYADRMSFYFISSLGCHYSQIDTPYKNLILANEKLIIGHKNMYVLRLPSIWGIKKSPLRAIGLIGKLLVSIKNCEEVNIYGELNTLRNYLSANKVGESIFKVISNKSNSANIYNFLGDFNYTINELIFLIKKITKKRVFYKIVSENPVHKESFRSVPNNGRNILVLECLNEEITKEWRSLLLHYQ